MRTLVMGDLHGAHKALLQCLERSKFDRGSDCLILLGDIADGHDGVCECVDCLLTIPNLIALKGNHDQWLREFIDTAYHPVMWNFGAVETARSYLRACGKNGKIIYKGQGYKTALNPRDIPESHRQLFASLQPYHIDNRNRCYVHAGFDPHREFAGQRESVYYWDRDLWLKAQAENGEVRMLTDFTDIFLGHTPTLHWGTDQPMQAGNIYNLDTGCGSTGRLTIMDADTKQYWQSDLVNKLASTVLPGRMRR